MKKNNSCHCSGKAGKTIVIVAAILAVVGLSVSCTAWYYGMIDSCPCRHSSKQIDQQACNKTQPAVNDDEVEKE